MRAVGQSDHHPYPFFHPKACKPCGSLLNVCPKGGIGNFSSFKQKSGGFQIGSLFQQKCRKGVFGICKLRHGFHLSFFQNLSQKAYIFSVVAFNRSSRHIHCQKEKKKRSLPQKSDRDNRKKEAAAGIFFSKTDRKASFCGEGILPLHTHLMQGAGEFLGRKFKIYTCKNALGRLY